MYLYLYTHWFFVIIGDVLALPMGHRRGLFRVITDLSVA